MESGLWQAVLGEIELSVSRGNFITWFKNTTLLKHDGNALTIGVPNVFIKQQLERKYNQLVCETLEKNGIQTPVVEYKIHALAGKQNHNADDNQPVLKTQTLTRTVQKNGESKTTISKLTHSYRQGLNERYTFENFIVGSGNELAHAACQAIAQNPGSRYNPLFLCKNLLTH
jgi:chromosomal replication initiator protein